MTTLRSAREVGNLEAFIAKREADGDAPGCEAEFNRVVRRLSETPKEARSASTKAPRAG